jgi:hypothetical protein
MDEPLKGRGGEPLTGLGLRSASVGRLGVLAQETRSIEEDETLSRIGGAPKGLNLCNGVEGAVGRVLDPAPRLVRIVD